jgi:Protein of unknown function (DUF1592)/Protein of unknown function (DUF1588)/Protein of unknown function (DUF1585)/Protein of unknown function (DUF1595)
MIRRRCLRVPKRRPHIAAAILAFVLAPLACAADTTAAPGEVPRTGPADAATPARMRLISQDQYFNSVGYLFGPDITVAAHFAPFRRTDGLVASGSASAGVTIAQLQEFQRTARSLAEQVVSPANRAYLVRCTPRRDNGGDPACARDFLLPVGRMLFRRPLDQPTADAVVARSVEAADQLHDFYGGLAVALEGLLMSPQALFVADRAEPDPARPGYARLDGYSLASRLSFFLWNAAPDEELLRAAENGELDHPGGLAKAVDHMLASPRLETGMRAFFDDMLRFDDLAVLAKDPGIYPAFGAETTADAREQTLRTLVDHLLVRKRDYRDLFTSRDTFISPSLAVIYGVATPPGWTAYTSPAGSARAGLLTQVSFLAANAHPGRSSATLRGKALRELLLCQTVPRPPPNVDFSLLEDAKSRLNTARERLALHRANPVCAGCHKLTDPIGLAFEHFDGAGQYRATERGAAIDTSGTLDGRNFDDLTGLSQAMHDHPQVGACLVKRVYAWATAGPTTPADKPMLDWLDGQFAADGYRLPDLLRTVALSSAFATIRDTATDRQRAAALAPVPARAHATGGKSP